MLALARSQQAICVHPFAQIRQILFSRSVTVERVAPSPFLGLSLTDKRNYDVGQNRTVAVETACGDGEVTIRH